MKLGGDLGLRNSAHGLCAIRLSQGCRSRLEAFGELPSIRAPSLHLKQERDGMHLVRWLRRSDSTICKTLRTALGTSQVQEGRSPSLLLLLLLRELVCGA